MKTFRIMGIPLPYYLILLGLLVVAIITGSVPGGLIGAFAFMMLVGSLLNLIGNHTPIVKTFLGGGPIVVIFGSAALVYFKVLPESLVETVDTFMKGGGFLNFYIAALITGSILGMSSKLLIKAAIRYLPTIIGGVAAALGLVAVGGLIFGQTPGESMAYIGIPIMGGGMGAGAVPLSLVFEKALQVPAEQIMSRLVPAVALGNAMAIVAGGVLDRIGKVKPEWTGNGKLMDIGEEDLIEDEKAAKPFTLEEFGVGIVVSVIFFIVGIMLSKLFKNLLGVDIHSYAYMIISVAVVKALRLLPEEIESACANWFQFVAKNWTSALLVGIGMAYTDLGQVIAALTPLYVLLVFLTVVGAIIGTAVIGKMLGFYPIEAAITAGLCMANMGGTGDVAVLTAANRMELMPFAQISSRLGGALIILLATFLVPLLF